MAERHDDNDGSDIFWPGYVDATTNLILNLLFLLTILIVAVFMFALELGRSTPIKQDQVPQVTVEMKTDVDPVVGTNAVLEEATDPVKENVELKREVKRLNELLAQQGITDVQAGGLAKAVDVTSTVPRPLKGLDKALASDFEVVVRFKDEAIDFTPEERDRLLEALQPIVVNGNPSIQVQVPPGFSEAKRMGFYRAMAVRNLLIELKVPQESVDVSVVEGENNDSNASLVRVRSR
jgi:hypothetical protein